MLPLANTRNVEAQLPPLQPLPPQIRLWLCPMCSGQMRQIAFIMHNGEIRKNLDHPGLD